MKTYSADSAAEISFPLGGIGTGSIGLSGNGALADWEICNRPARRTVNPFSHFAIKAEDGSGVLDMRVLQGDAAGGFMGSAGEYGYGPGRGTMAGIRHFEHVEFRAEFPFAKIAYSDRGFPGAARLTAFNPFIPSDGRDSSIPAAFFEFSLTNTSKKTLRYTIALSASNPFGTYGPNEFTEKDGVGFLSMHSGVTDRGSCGFAELTLATDCEERGHQDCWRRGKWFEELSSFLEDFSAPGPIRARRYDAPAENKPDTATLTASVTARPGETRRIRFVISWFVPNCHMYWDSWDSKDRPTPPDHPDWQNYYAKSFSGSRAAAEYCFKNRDRLYGRSLLFSRALLGSSLPSCVLDAVQGNLATLKSTACLRLTDGDFYGWEGVNADFGSCFGSCQHVWNYAYALPFLFPELERGLRTNEIKYSLEKCGRMHFRMRLPLGSEPWSFRACVDGQMGTVMKCFREWKISGDTQWLRENWAAIRSMIEFAWSPENEDRWDPGRTGVITGRQHHTLDKELYGAYSWLTGFYHGALLAGAEMARAMGDESLAGEYLAIYKKGHEWLEANTFNGEYYIQALDLKDPSTEEKFPDETPKKPGADTLRDAESGEIKYQIGSGCGIDQVLADWHASLMGLPRVFDPAHRKSALESVYKYNYKNMRDFSNPCRVFALNGESGVVMFSWPDRAGKPAVPIPYAGEMMTGFEYAFAGSLLQCGMEKEALSVVSSVRGRYDGKKRNPFSEIECGASYARAMSSYALLLIYSGFIYDLSSGTLGFRPLHNGRYFWSAGGAWGSVSVGVRRVRFEVLYGNIALKRFIHPLRKVRSVLVNGAPVPFSAEDGAVLLRAGLKAGDLLLLK